MTQDRSVYAQWWHEDAQLGFTHALDMTRIHAEDSAFQNIEVFDHATFGRVLVLDGLIQASQADEFIYHEMAVHVPLLGRKRDKVRALIIGGGDGGLLRELLVHDHVAEVTMVEIDRRVIEVSNEYLGVQGNYDDPRVTLVCDDAADYVAQAARDGRRFDVVFLDITEPVGPSASLFKQDFLDNLVTVLSDDGVCVDSDSVFVCRDRVRFLQETSSDADSSLLEIMRSGRFFPEVSVYRSIVPMYPGAEFGFFLYSKDGYDYRTPFRDYTGGHYNAAVHTAAFALPTWWRTQLGFSG